MAHELALPKDRICKTQMLSVLVTEYADCSRPTQHRTLEGAAWGKDRQTHRAGKQSHPWPENKNVPAMQGGV